MAQGRRAVSELTAPERRRIARLKAWTAWRTARVVAAAEDIVAEVAAVVRLLEPEPRRSGKSPYCLCSHRQGRHQSHGRLKTESWRRRTGRCRSPNCDCLRFRLAGGGDEQLLEDLRTEPEGLAEP